MSEEILGAIDWHCISFLRFYVGDFPSSCLKFSVACVLSKKSYGKHWAMATAIVVTGSPMSYREGTIKSLFLAQEVQESKCDTKF